MASLFDCRLRAMSLRHAKIVQRYEIARSLIEFLAAAAFIAGSALFFYPDQVYAGTWLFLVGSIFFAVRPTIRLAMELHLARIPVPDGLEALGAA